MPPERNDYGGMGDSVADWGAPEVLRRTGQCRGSREPLRNVRIGDHSPTERVGVQTSDAILFVRALWYRVGDRLLGIE